MKSSVRARVFAVLLSVGMVLSLFPAPALAEALDEMQAALTEQQESPAQDTGGESEEAPSDDEETPKEEKSEKGESTPQDAPSAVTPQGEDASAWPSFSQSSEVEGVRIKVEAPEGTFPAGARLVAKKVTNEQEEQATAAVDEVRPDDQNVARTYIYDIKVTDEQGTELQPANDHEVKVSFALAQETGEAVEANVYHVVEQPEANELEAEQLKTEVDGKQGIVRAQTDGFSVYVVQLTYGGLNYQMPFGSSVELQKILDAVGIKGEAGLAQVFPKDNNPLIFSVQKLQDTWFVVSSQTAPDDAANAKGQLVVDAGGSRYTIELTAASAGMVTIHKEWVDAEGLPLEPQDDQLAVTINYTVTNPPAEEGQGDPAPVPGGGSEDPAPASGYVASGTLTLDEGNDWSQAIAVPEPFSGTITLEEEAIPGFKATEWVLNNENRYVLPFDGTKATLDLSKFYDEQGAYDTANVNAIIEDGTAKITVANESTSEGVDYVNRWWDGSSVQQQTLRIYDAGGTLHNVEYLIRDGWDGAMQDGHWYVVRGEAVLPDMRFTVQGTAHLILCDGAKLTLGQGIQVPQGATLNVYGQESDSGELIATAEKGNAGIGGNSGSSAGTIVIQGGNVSSRGGESASGIGAGFGAGAQYENVNILGGSVTSYGGFYGAGIGGGQDNRNIGTTTVYGGTVAATGGMRAAGMGSGMCTDAGTVESSGSVVIEGGDVHATGQGEDDGRSGGAGIGGGSNAPGCRVTINHGSVEAIGGAYAAGIGGGSNGGGGAVFATGGVVTINGGTVVANGGNQGAGIGGGLRGANTKVVVTGGDVTARGGNTAAGIGSGGDVPLPEFGGEVSLEGGSVKAFGGIGGAGIGGGTDCDGATLRITGGEVYASGGKNAAGIGGGGDGPDSGTSGGNGGNTTIQGGHVTAQGGENGAGIGSGEGSSFDSSAMGGVTVIQGGTVFATGGDDGAGIGGGQHANGNQVTISGGLVNAAGGINAAGIGCGLGASGGNVTITGGIVDAISPKGGAGIGGGSNSSGANVSVTGGIVVANAGAEDIRAIGKGEQPFISFNSDKDLTLGDAIGCTYGKRAYIQEGVATKETRVARCRDHSYVRLENLANSIEVKVAWTDPNSDQHPISIKIAYRQRKRDGTVARSGTIALPKNNDGTYTGRVFVEPDFDGTIEFEESAIDGYRIKTWDFGVPAQGDGEAQTYDTASNAGEKSYPPYQFDPMAKPDVATAIRSGTGVCTVTNEPYLPLVIRKAWPGNDGVEASDLPEQVSIQYTLANATGSAQPAALTLKPSDDGKNKAWEGTINLATQGGERYDVVTLKEDPVPDGFLANGWKLDVGSIDEGLVCDVPSAGSQERDKATARLVLNTRESTPFSEGELTKIWQAIKAEKATVTITNAVSKTFHVQKEWLLADQQAPKPQSIQAQLARRVVANDGKVTWEGLQTVVLSEQNDWSADFSPVAASDDDEYIIRELTRDDKLVYAATDEGAPADWTGEVEYEVGPEDGKHIEYYVASYAYGQDEQGNEDSSRTIITNAVSQEFSVRKTWVLGSHTSERPAAVSAVLQRADDGDATSWTTVQTVELNEQNDWRATFKRVPSVEWGEDGEVRQISYRVRELDKDGEVVCAQVDADAPKPEPADEGGEQKTYQPVAKLRVATGQDDGHDAAYFVSYEPAKDAQGNEVQNTTQITNTLGRLMRVQKTWDIDLEGKDRPSKVKVRLQRRDDSYKPESQDSQGEKWEDVQTIELSATNDWEGTFDAVPMFKQSTNTDGSPEEYTYRVRELDKDDKVVYNKGDKDDFGFIETLKGKVTDWDALWQVDWTTDAWKKYITDKKTAPQTPVAIFKVEGSKPHETKYLVSYATEGDTTKITNTAVMDVSIYKRWLMFGEAKKPESVYLMLMGRVKQTQGSSGSAAGGAAGSASGATNKVPYLPVYNALYGDVLTGSGLADIVGIKGTLNKVGVKDETINGTVKLGLALAKAKDNPDNALTAWRVRFGVRKYDAITKMEMEYLGAELVTGLIKIGTDTITGFSWPAMLQPISPRYLSVFGKAFNIFRDYELTSNVINTWLSLDGDIVDGVGGTKYWKDNNNADGKRPSEVKLHLYYKDDKDNKVEVTGSPVTVKASDNWAWSLGFKKGDPAVGKTLIVEEEVPEGYTCQVDGYDVTNTRDANAPQTVTVEGKKTWEDGNDADGKRPGSIVVRLMANGKEKDRQTVTAANGWKWTFASLPKIDESGKQISYTIEEEAVSGYRTSVVGYNITNTHEYATVGVRVFKVWDDANDADGKRPSSVTVHLTGAGEEKSLTLDEASGWSGTFSNLPKLDGSGNQIEYVVDEDAVEGYQKSVEGNAISGYTITNRHEPQKTEVKVTKVWNDANDQDGLRPEALEVRLQANGSDAGKSVTLDEASGWSGTFSDLPKYAGGEEVAYTIREEVVAGYESKTEGTASEGFTITNTHEPRKVDVRVTKHWVDAENQVGKRPASVTVHLRANDEDMGAKTLSADSGWSATWEGMDRFKDGEEVSFEVAEDAVEGYQADVSGDADQGFVVTNTLDPGTTTVEGRKTWDDERNRDGVRPGSITVRLRANGKEIKTKTVSGDATSNEGWTWKWEGLPKYEDGKEIAYTVTEDAVPNYTTSVSGYDVTNTHAPNKTSVSVTKRWDDDGNRDGLRPTSVRVQLLANDQAMGEPVTLSLSAAWTHTFSDLDQNDASGKRIAYTVREVGTVEGYQATVEGNAMQGFVITNKHEPQKTTVKARKVWDDDHNRDGKRPAYITVRLMDGSREAARQTLSVGEADEQTFEFAGVLTNQGGKPISYTLAEEAVADYVATYGSDDDGTLVVTNTHEPQTIPFKGTKLWEDDENRDGIRPDSITVHVRREGSQTDVLAKTIRASEQGEWSWEFDGLYRYQNGEEVSYVLTEDPIEGYQTSISGTAEQGYTITNRHKPTTREISVAKVWDDNNDQDGLRPQTVLVWLLANGKRTGAKLSLSQGDNWRGRFANLPVNEGGQPITYTVEEDVPSGYEATVTGDAAAGFTVTNRHEPQTVSVEGRKTWVDSNDYAGMRPNKITVRLRANGEVVGSKTVSAADDWSWKWENLAKYSDGKQIAYTVTEDAVAHYVVAYDGTNVQNTYARDKVSVDVTRVWKDADDQDGIRPAFVKLVLKANGEPVATSKGFVVISSYDSGTYTFTGLPKQDKDGKDIDYTVEEELTNVLTGTDGPGTYAVEVTGNATSGFVVTNTHTPQTVTVAGAKTWEDDGNAANLRPGRITIRLRANGVVCGIKNVWGTQTTDEGWSWRFEDLPMYERGKRITYTITEDAVEYYEQSYDGYNVTNTLNADDRRGRVSVELNRVWDDFNNADLLRPKYVTVRLLANGEPIAGEKYFMVLSDYDNGSYRFTGLPKTDEYGDEIVYTVEEVRTDVLGDEDTPSSYAVHILGDAEQGFTIVNVHTPELVSVKGQKVWDDEGYEEERPDSIVVRLLANGEESESSDVAAAADGTWRWEFDDLPKYLAGKAVTYEVEEEAVRGYEATVEGDMSSGFTVTNKYRPDDPHPDDPTQATYAVQVYYERDGAYADKPDDEWVRTAAVGAEVSVTDEDTMPARERYDLDDRYANARTGVVAADGSLVLKVYFRQVFLITYDPNGGVLDGDTSNVVERYYYGDEITIRKAPTLAGSSFTYWKGSAYHPGDAYTVTADHTFVAQWKKTTKPGDNTPDKTTPPHTPGSTTTVKIPRTGDSTVATSWLLAPAAAVLAIAFRRRRA